ncbi:MAG: ribonuclease H-like domain-containing protein [Mizugakiibacter sp.]|uniref:ribonuclease H-like domain-containing protein n=1 Tax=Mizugakiibacter sp. TaxID=1972610 RepID=UPI0031C91C84|nr:ribonuclease H-like domain-containing protein [Xanthomonadaceae bacterium]
MSPSPRPRAAAGEIDALRRLLGLRERAARPASHRAEVDRALPGEEIAPGLRLLEARAPWPALPEVVHLAASPAQPLARERLLAFDTETTGLAGGTGTRAFMIGAADWHDGALRLRQLYITCLGAEGAMLRAFADWLREDTALVSYNGRCYDAPLLATRYRLARLANPLAGLVHVDLLHAVRRRYRGLWPNCRLLTAERMLLDVLREDDLPGAEAPQAWLTYLRGGAATNLRRVADHNAQDLRSLAGLLAHLAHLEANG